MLVTLLGSFLRDALKLMKTETDFMERSENERRDLIKRHMGETYPAALVDYLATVKEASFLEQIKGAIDFLDEGLVPDNKLLLEALADYAAKEFAFIFDQFDRDFFFAEPEERENALQKAFPGDSFFQRAVRDYVMGSTYQEITEEGQQLLRDLKGDPTIVVQSSVEVDRGTRGQVRTYFRDKHPYSFVEFQINPQIIGGLRVFIDGQVMDHSWLSKIQRISQLAYQLS